MTKTEALRRLELLRNAVGQLPEDVCVISADASSAYTQPEIHLRDVPDGVLVATRRHSMKTIQHYWDMAGCRVFSLENSPVPDGI